MNVSIHYSTSVVIVSFVNSAQNLKLWVCVFTQSYMYTYAMKCVCGQSCVYRHVHKCSYVCMCDRPCLLLCYQLPSPLKVVTHVICMYVHVCESMTAVFEDGLATTPLNC